MEAKDIEKLKAGRGEFNFNGNLCKQIIGGWVIHGVTCSTPEEVEEVILNACSIINESIDRGMVVVKSRNDNFKCTNNER